MSRIGKKPVAGPVERDGDGQRPDGQGEGPEGRARLHGAGGDLKVEKTAEGIEVTPREDTKMARSMWGMSRTQVANLIKGVTQRL